MHSLAYVYSGFPMNDPRYLVALALLCLLLMQCKVRPLLLWDSYILTLSDYVVESVRLNYLAQITSNSIFDFALPNSSLSLFSKKKASYSFRILLLIVFGK